MAQSAKHHGQHHLVTVDKYQTQGSCQGLIQILFSLAKSVCFFGLAVSTRSVLEMLGDDRRAG
jgi:hypothetical protein